LLFARNPLKKDVIITDVKNPLMVRKGSLAMCFKSLELPVPKTNHTKFVKEYIFGHKLYIDQYKITYVHEIYNNSNYKHPRYKSKEISEDLNKKEALVA
jgi:hypothetical protein